MLPAEELLAESYLDTGNRASFEKADRCGRAAGDAYIARQLKYDPDLWVLEFEAPDLRPPFEATVI